MSPIARNKPVGGYSVGTVKYPRLPAYLVGEPGREMLAVWCCFCDVWHAHAPEYGHRVAHCYTGSPYKATGYVLTDPKTLERKR